MPTTDPLKSSAGFQVPAQAGVELIEKINAESLAARLASPLNVTGAGSEILVQTELPQAYWVEEAALKPSSAIGMDRIYVKPHKLATIVKVSTELLEDHNALWNELSVSLTQSLATGLDQAVFTGTAAPAGVHNLADAEEITITDGIYPATVDALEQVQAVGRGRLNGFVLSPYGEAAMLREVDTAGRPLFINNVQTDGSVGSILGRTTWASEDLPEDTFGIAGDWNALRIGFVGGIKLKPSADATIDGESMFQTNQVAFLAEMRVAVAVTNEARFARIVMDTDTETP